MSQNNNDDIEMKDISKKSSQINNEEEINTATNNYNQNNLLIPIKELTNEETEKIINKMKNYFINLNTTQESIVNASNYFLDITSKYPSLIEDLLRFISEFSISRKDSLVFLYLINDLIQKWKQKNKNNLENIDNSELIRMQKLREGLQIQPHFDFGIPLNENASLSIIQKFKDKKEINENFQKTLSKINILKWLKVYTVLMNKEIQNVNLCLNQLKKLYSFDLSKSSILCEVKNIYIIDCYQLLDVIDANFKTKKIILTKNIKKNSKDKGKIKIFYEYFVNIGDLILFKKPYLKPNVVFGEEYLEMDIKDIQKIVPFDIQ